MQYILPLTVERKTEETLVAESIFDYYMYKDIKKKEKKQENKKKKETLFLIRGNSIGKKGGESPIIKLSR